MKNILSQEETNRIHSICKSEGIENYTINNDGSIDVDGSIDLSGKGYTELPIQFRKVAGDFSCANNKLTTLKGCPDTVESEFNASYNKLYTLYYCPRVTFSFYVGDNKLPKVFMNMVPEHLINFDEQIDEYDEKLMTFLKYQNHSDIWSLDPKKPLNVDKMWELVEEIKEGME